MDLSCHPPQEAHAAATGRVPWCHVAGRGWGLQGFGDLALWLSEKLMALGGGMRGLRKMGLGRGQEGGEKVGPERQWAVGPLVTAVHRHLGVPQVSPKQHVPT